MAGGIAERAVLDKRYVKGTYRRLLSPAFVIRALVLHSQLPQAQLSDAFRELAGDLALLPWSQQWEPGRSGPGLTGAKPSARNRCWNCSSGCWPRPGTRNGRTGP